MASSGLVLVASRVGTPAAAEGGQKREGRRAARAGQAGGGRAASLWAPAEDSSGSHRH